MSVDADPYPIRPITPAENDTWREVLRLAFNGPASERDEERPFLLEHDRSLAAFDRDRMVATTAAYSFEMTVPGGPRPVAGVTMVSVLPTHTRRGLLRSLMTRQLTDLHEGGEPVAALFASESSIYGRFGYGPASRQLALRLQRGDGRLDRGVRLDPRLALRLADPADVRKELARVYDTRAVARPGSLVRDAAWWDKLLGDLRRHARDEALQCAVVEDGSGPRGYAFLAIARGWDHETGLPDHQLTVWEPLALDPDAYAALWRHILDRDLISAVTVPKCAVDEPLLRLLADPRRARPRVSDDLWVRLADVGRALAARAYARPIDIVIDVVDEVCSWNAGRWRLAGDENGATCERTRDPADAQVHVRELGAAYLGDAGLSGAVDAGLAVESTAGALRALAAAMSWEPKPLCTTMF